MFLRWFQLLRRRRLCYMRKRCTDPRRYTCTKFLSRRWILWTMPTHRWCDINFYDYRCNCRIVFFCIVCAILSWIGCTTYMGKFYGRNHSVCQVWFELATRSHCFFSLVFAILYRHWRCQTRMWNIIDILWVLDLHDDYSNFCVVCSRNMVRHYFGLF